MSNDERRNSFRFPLSEELRGAVLEAGSQRLPVELLDQSAEGFSVQAPRDVEIALDQVVTIETWAGRCEAVVARLVDGREYRRVGLRRVSDITVCAARAPSWGGWLKQKFSRRPDEASCQPATDCQPATGEKSGKQTALAVAAIAATLLIAAGWMLKPATKPATLASQRPTSGAAHDDDALAIDPETSTTEESVAASRSAAGTTGQAATGVGATTDNPPPATLERLAALRSPQVASELALSEQQKLEISRLLKKVSSEVSRARARLGGKSRAAREARLSAIVAQAADQAKAILNPEQQARWQSE